MKKIIYFILFSSVASAQEIPSIITTVGSVDKNSSLRIECSPASKSTIKCVFTQLSFKNKDYRNEEIPPEDLIKKEIPSILKNCKDTDYGDIQTEYIKEDIASFKKGCDCYTSTKSISCFTQVLKDKNELKSNLCSIMHHSFEKTLTKIAPGKYQATVGPEGHCDVVNSFLLEKDGKNDWKYTQIRISRSSESQLCKMLDVNIPSEYSTKNPKIVPASCRYFDLNYY